MTTENLETDFVRPGWTPGQVYANALFKPWPPTRLGWLRGSSTTRQAIPPSRSFTTAGPAIGSRPS